MFHRAGKELKPPVFSSSNTVMLWTTQASLPPPPSQGNSHKSLVVATMITLYIDKAKRKTPLTEEISYLLLQLLSCFFLEAYILEFMCTFQTTIYTLHQTTYSAFSFSVISCSTLHCYSICWHLNFLTVIFPVQVLDSGEKHVIKDW